MPLPRVATVKLAEWTGMKFEEATRPSWARQRQRVVNRIRVTHSFRLVAAVSHRRELCLVAGRRAAPVYLDEVELRAGDHSVRAPSLGRGNPKRALWPLVQPFGLCAKGRSFARAIETGRAKFSLLGGG